MYFLASIEDSCGNLRDVYQRPDGTLVITGNDGEYEEVSF